MAVGVGSAGARWCRVAVAALAIVAGVAGCGGNDGDDDGSAPQADVPVADPGPVHVHGLGINPADGSLFIATHTGLFRAGPGERKAVRVRDRFQDTMGFTVTGPDRFLGSGHPDGREDLPPFLGLIRSTDAGKTWQPVSLLGERDFHVLEATGRYVYGYGSDYESRTEGFLVSADGGRTWSERAVPEPLLSLAIAPGREETVVAAGENGMYLSEDAGRRWRQLGPGGGLVAWSDRLVVVRFDGRVRATDGAGGRFAPVGGVGGEPAALDAGPDGDLYVALHDGTVKRSADAGASWTVRSAP